MESHLETTQRLITESANILVKLKLGNEKGDKIIHSIVALNGTEPHMRKRLKEYGTKIQTKIEAYGAKIQTKIEARASLPATAPLSNYINDMNQQLTKFKPKTIVREIIRYQSINLMVNATDKS